MGAHPKTNLMTDRHSFVFPHSAPPVAVQWSCVFGIHHKALTSVSQCTQPTPVTISVCAAVYGVSADAARVCVCVCVVFSCVCCVSLAIECVSCACVELLKRAVPLVTVWVS